MKKLHKELRKLIQLIISGKATRRMIEEEFNKISFTYGLEITAVKYLQIVSSLNHNDQMTLEEVMKGGN